MTSVSRHSSRGLRTLYLAFLLLWAGCGESGPKLYQVSGTVTLDGRPLEYGSIQFFSSPSSQVPMISTTVIEDGAYKLSPKGGLLPGTYQVAIRSAGGRSSSKGGDKMEVVSSDDGSVEILPENYNNKTELTCDVSPDKPTVADFDLTSPKPKSKGR